MQILPHLHSLRVATQAIEDMDVDLSFADVAFEMGWVRPIIDDKYDVYYQCTSPHTYVIVEPNSALKMAVIQQWRWLPRRTDGLSSQIACFSNGQSHSL